MRLFETPVASAIACVTTLMAVYCLILDVKTANWITAAAVFMVIGISVTRVRRNSRD